tara:strand:+ start:202 stop:2448 length:2247 start_codon:yes stop_codon:yes gene_type:complete
MDEGSKKDYSEQEVPPVEQTIITNDILDMSMKKWSYLSYFLLILAFSTSNEMDYFESSGNDVPLYFTFLYVMAVLSFLRYNYLRYIDNDYSEITFFNQSSYLKVVIQLFLYIWLLPHIFFGPLEFVTFVMYDGGWGSFIRSLHPILLFLVIISLSFEKKNLKETEDELKETEDELKETEDELKETEGGIVITEQMHNQKGLTPFIQTIAGFLAFIIFLIGALFVQMDIYANWGIRSGTFDSALPCYSITFILLVLMIAAGLGAQGASEPSQKEKIKAANWKKFKTRMIVLVVVFSLLMALLWNESETYWENEEDKYLNLDQDCNDAIIGSDINLVNADLSDLYLYGCDLSNRDLTGADFTGTELRCVDFSNSILIGANFGSGYDNYYYDLVGEISWDRSEKAPNIKHVTFDNADLSKANFNGSGYNSVIYGGRYHLTPDIDCPYDLSFKGANLTNSYFDTLFGAPSEQGKLIFDNAIMDNANFLVSVKDYRQVSFDNAKIDNANFVVDASRLSYWSLNTPVSIVNVSFNGTDISMTMLPGTNLSQSDMSEANFIDVIALDLASCPSSLPEGHNCAEIGGKKMIFGPGMDFSNRGIRFSYVDSLNDNVPGVNFSNLYVPNSTFHGVQLSNSYMINANLSYSNFSYNHDIYNGQYLEYNNWLEYSDEENRTHLEAVLDEWGVDNFSDFKSLWSANLTNVDFTGANLSYSDFSYSNMLGAKLENATLTGAKWYYTICPDGTNSGKAGSCVS